VSLVAEELLNEKGPTLELGVWCFFGIWILVFGVSDLLNRRQVFTSTPAQNLRAAIPWLRKSCALSLQNPKESQLSRGGM